MTPEFLNFIEHPIVLAVWYGDDGFYYTDKRLIGLATQGFTREENELLAQWLNERWGIEANVDRHGGKYYVLVLTERNSQRFLDLTWRYIAEAIPEKLPPWYTP